MNHHDPLAITITKPALTIGYNLYQPSLLLAIIILTPSLTIVLAKIDYLFKTFSHHHSQLVPTIINHHEPWIITVIMPPVTIGYSRFCNRHELLALTTIKPSSLAIGRNHF